MLETISLTAAEEHRLEAALDERLHLSAPIEIVRPWEWWFNLAVRPLVAAAAVLVISLGSMKASLPSANLTPIVEEVTSSNLAENGVLSLLTNGETGYVSEALDQASLSYLTQNIQGFQAADLLEDISEDEMQHLVENLSMEL